MSQTNLRQCIFEHLEDCTQNGVHEMGGARLSKYVLDSLPHNAGVRLRDSTLASLRAAKTFPVGTRAAVQDVIESKNRDIQW